MCLPTSCTSNEADDGLGDGIPDSVSCMLDLMENIDTVAKFAGLFLTETFNNQPDYTGLQTLCQENDMDYFTLSFSQTCDDGSSLDVQDMPQCLPSSCTSDEATLKAMLADMTSDESHTDSGPVCTESDYIFSGLDEEETTSGASFRAGITGSV